ncbi:MAG TPA: carboxypeptidase regulatory-like domain-containing protein [Thermoanaerobaculia bacterium]|nr:carboxypeptidase regulatory-like domain-containing protein [Thermoanaerobaculia bacterium]
MRAAIRLLPLVLLAIPALAAPPIPVTGLVQGPAGSPLEGARALLVPVPSSAAQARLELEGKTGPEPAASVLTRADGTFRLEAPEAGLWKVVVQASGMVPREMELEPLVEDTELPAVKLEKDAGLEVRVTGADGAPVTGARVRAVQPEPFPARAFFMIGSQESWTVPESAARTDARGVAVLPRGGRGKVTVQAGLDGGAMAEQEVAGGSATLRLQAGSRRQVRVLDATGKKPVADALVLLGGIGGIDGVRWCAGRTSADGLFDVPLGAGPRQSILVLAADGRRLEAAVEPAKKEEKDPLPLVLPALESLAGRVVSIVDGRPVAGALVWGGDPGLLRRAGADGTYRIELASRSGRETLVRAAAPGFFTETGSPTGPAGRRQGPALALQPSLAVAGVVVDEKGMPVAGVEIRASPQMSGGFDSALLRTAGTARTTPAGRFRVPRLSPGVAYDLRFSRTGFAPATSEAPPLEPGRPAADLRVVLRKGRTGFGRVVNASEQPIAGARVSLRRSAAGDRRRPPIFSQEEPGLEVVTGADGRFEIRDLPGGTWSLDARASGYAPLTVPGLTIPEGAGSTDLGTVMLPPGVAVEGYAVDPRGRPVEGVEVNVADGSMSIVRMRMGRGQDSQPAAVTGSDGYFRIEDRRAGETINLDASRPGYATTAAPGIRVPPEEPVRIVMQPASAVEGRTVDDDGQPVAGAKIILLPTERRGGFRIKDGVSDESGAFRIEDVPPGALEAQAVAAGFQPAYLSNLEVRAGQDLKGVEIVLATGAAVEGRVLSPAGKPVVGATIELAEEEGAGMFRIPVAAMSDGDGRYRLDGIKPGTRTFQATHPGYRRAVRDLEVRPGENALDLSLEGGVEVRGRVVDDGGAPVPGASVSLREGWRSWDLPRGTSGADGSFTLTGVADGNYHLSAQKEGYAIDPDGEDVTVAGSSVGGLEVKLSRGGTVTGQLLGLDFTDLSQVQISSDSMSWRGGGGTVRPDGTYRIENLAPGKRRIIASLRDGSRQAEGQVEIEPGVSETRLDLDFGQGAMLTGRVLRNGEPLSSAMVSLNGPGANRWGQTDHEGRFRFEALPDGRYELAVSTGGGTRHEENVDMAGDDRDLLIDLRAVAVSGRVTDAADRSPIAGASVVLLPREGGAGEAGRFFPVETSTDSRGAFRLADVAEGAWKLRVTQEGYAPAEEEVVVETAPVEGVELALQATEGVTLEVVLPNGRPPSEVRSAVLDSSGRLVSTGRHTVREGGRVRISSVAPGSWELILDTDGWAPVSVPVTAPGDAGRVVLAQPGAVRVEVPALADGKVGGNVRFTDAAGRPFRAIWGDETLSDFPLQNGARDFQRLPVGAWTLTVTAADGRTWTGTATVTPAGKPVVKLE